MNVHFIGAELAKRGAVRVFSLGFSLTSYLRHDARLPLIAAANKPAEYNGVSCYLWKTLLHPFNLSLPASLKVSEMLFRIYRQQAPDVLRQWILQSDTIIFESGMAPIFIEMVARLNPSARKIYLVSDLLETIGCDPFIAQELDHGMRFLDEICVPSRKMACAFPEDAPVVYVPHGLDTQLLSVVGSNPYGGGVNAVSVGSMLFDPSVFAIAAAARPDIIFHVIGGGHRAKRLRFPNVKIYGEIPHQETLRYIKYADFGIAPYVGDQVDEYLCDTSMKLMQYAALEVPAICPDAAVGAHEGRFGYSPGDPNSIVRAIERALRCGRFKTPPVLSWSEVTDRILEPDKFADTTLGAAWKAISKATPICGTADNALSKGQRRLSPRRSRP